MQRNETLEDDDIISRFLGWRAKRFVRQARAEWASYMRHPYWYSHEPGMLHRDAVRFRLESLAYRRYAITLTP